MCYASAMRLVERNAHGNVFIQQLDCCSCLACMRAMSSNLETRLHRANALPHRALHLVARSGSLILVVAHSTSLSHNYTFGSAPTCCPIRCSASCSAHIVSSLDTPNDPGNSRLHEAPSESGLLGMRSLVRNLNIPTNGQANAPPLR